MTTHSPNIKQNQRTLDSKVLEILVCPMSRGLLIYDREKQELVSKKANLAYPIQNGIPLMVPEQARTL